MYLAMMSIADWNPVGCIAKKLSNASELVMRCFICWSLATFNNTSPVDRQSIPFSLELCILRILLGSCWRYAENWFTWFNHGSRMKAAMCRPVPLPCDPSSVAHHRTSPRLRTLAPAESIMRIHLSTGYKITTRFPFLFSDIAFLIQAVGPFFLPS